MDVPVEVERSDSVPVTLLARVRQGDHAAFTELVVAHDAGMVRLCLVICRDPDLARDATQSAWHRLWSQPPALRDEAKLRSWLLSVAANEARQQLRRQRVGLVRELRAQQAPRTTDPAGEVDRLDLDGVLARLDASERELLGLRYVLGMNSGEIGAHLCLSPEGVRSRLQRLLTRMRKDLDDG
jgi:RNA polymerase sigma-70 factor (ECF subfamily)